MVNIQTYHNVGLYFFILPLYQIITLQISMSTSGLGQALYSDYGSPCSSALIVGRLLLCIVYFLVMAFCKDTVLLRIFHPAILQLGFKLYKNFLDLERSFDYYNKRVPIPQRFFRSAILSIVILCIFMCYMINLNQELQSGHISIAVVWRCRVATCSHVIQKLRLEWHQSN
jgi:hypothetical protein